MAHSPSFNRSNSNPASRLAYERPWLVLLAVLGIFAFYVASGNYSFTRPLLGNNAAPTNLTEPPSISQGAIVAPISQTSSTSFSADTGAIVESAGGSTTATTAGTETRSAASTEATASAEATGPVRQASAAGPATDSAPQAAPITAAPAAIPPAERWANAGILFVTEGQEWDEKSLANVDAALSMLPSSILANLGNPALGEMHILVNTQGRSLNGSQPYGGAANYFSTNNGVNELVLYPGQRVVTVLHELGHAYNLRSTPAGHYAQVMVQPEMESFLAATGWRILTPRETVATMVDHTEVAFDYEGSFTWPEVSHFDPLEDFANSFAMYYADPDGLRAASPQRYDWMAANLPN